MSRHIDAVGVQVACEVFGMSAEEAAEYVMGDNIIEVAHGYDNVPGMPAYFCDVMPDCERGIWYGVMGFGKRMNKGEYYEAMKKLGLLQAADAVAMDRQY